MACIAVTDICRHWHKIIRKADIRLFVTLVRFDRVYYVHFKCSKKAIKDYPHLFAYTRDVYQQPGIGDTIHMDHIASHYYCT